MKPVIVLSNNKTSINSGIRLFPVQCYQQVVPGKCVKPVFISINNDDPLFPGGCRVRH